MKKVFLYILIFVMAAYNTGLPELFKIPAFISHYTEHRADNSAAGIAEFIKMHYLGQDKNDHDTDKDNALPFKQSTYRSNIAIIAQPVNPATVIIPRIFISKKIARSCIDPLTDEAVPAMYKPPCDSFFS